MSQDDIRPDTGADTSGFRDELFKRIFDVTVAGIGIIVLLPVMALCALAIRCTSKGPAIHISDRIGASNRHFNMYKFRTMRVETPQLATHLMTDSSKSFVTPVGRFLRKISLDELPQLFNVLKGDMTIVGPRPALFNQDDQIALRTRAGCHVLKPGITGWAQVNGRDSLSIERKVELDAWYFQNRSMRLDLKILWLTVKQVFTGHQVSH